MEVVTQKKLAYIDNQTDRLHSFKSRMGDGFEIVHFENGFKFFEWHSKGNKIDAIVSAGQLHSPNGLVLLQHLKQADLEPVPFIFLVDTITGQIRSDMLKHSVSEVFEQDVAKDPFEFRLNYLIEHNIHYKRAYKEGYVKQPEYKIPLGKRIFDIVFATLALIFLSPLFLLLAILIKLESKGPVFYAAKRVGTGYKIFDFYKFRSMSADADKKLKDLAHLNQYSKNKKYPESEDKKETSETTDENIAHQVLCEECASGNTGCQSMLFLDGKEVCEKRFILEKKEKDAAAFIKINNDPRVTKIGKFIRNTSIDELPQLFNVLKGDMSIVGNRPLPLYEAEKITVDQFTLRFLAPAGITGLWQVTKRGTKEMSESERIQLDNDYARNYSFWRDLVIIAKTIPALLQKENV